MSQDAEIENDKSIIIKVKLVFNLSPEQKIIAK